MSRVLIGIAVAAAALLVAGCGGGGGTPQATTGNVSGTLTVGGPINGASDLLVGLFAPGSTTPTVSSDAGHVTSAASGTAVLTGRNIAYSFSEVPFGTYDVGLYFLTGSTPTFLYRSSDIALSATNPTLANQDGTASFTGPGPYGTISGVTQVGGTWPDASQLVFIGFAPADQPQNVFQWLVSAEQLNGGLLYFNVDKIAYGTYSVGLYGYDPVTHNVSVFGMLDNPVTINATTPDVAGANFPSNFAGDPGADPQLGSITGSVTLNGALPDNLYIYVAANTIPPQQGAPPAAVQVTQADVVDGKISFDLPFLEDGDYSVSIFSYDINTHQATYFGEDPDTVTVSNHNTVSGIDFSADVTLL
jgi:hypothetical protein